MKHAAEDQTRKAKRYPTTAHVGRKSVGSHTGRLLDKKDCSVTAVNDDSESWSMGGGGATTGTGV